MKATAKNCWADGTTRSTGNAFDLSTIKNKVVMGTPQEQAKVRALENAAKANKTSRERGVGHAAKPLTGLSKRAERELSKSTPQMTIVSGAAAKKCLAQNQKLRKARI